MLDFIQKWNQLFVVLTHRSSQEIRKLESHFLCQLRFCAYKRNDGIKAVEQKVRLQLLTQVVKFSFANQSFGFQFSTIIFDGFFLHIPKDIDDHDTSKQQKVNNKLVRQLLVIMCNRRRVEKLV